MSALAAAEGPSRAAAISTVDTRIEKVPDSHVRLLSTENRTAHHPAFLTLSGQDHEAKLWLKANVPIQKLPSGLFADTASEAMLSDLLAGSMGTPVLVNLAGWFDRFHTMRLIHSPPQACSD